MTTNDDKIFNIVIGTAGHIDHGKSSMVQRPVSYTHLTLPTIYSV